MYLGFLYTDYTPRELTRVEKNSFSRQSYCNHIDNINTLIVIKKSRIFEIIPFKIKEIVYDESHYTIIVLGTNLEKFLISIETLQEL